MILGRIRCRDRCKNLSYFIRKSLGYLNPSHLSLNGDSRTVRDVAIKNSTAIKCVNSELIARRSSPGNPGTQQRSGHSPTRPQSERTELRCAQLVQFRHARRSGERRHYTAPPDLSKDFLSNRKKVFMQLIQSTMDSKGRITIPRIFREELKMEDGGSVDVSLNLGSLVIKPSQPRCVFCNSITTNTLLNRYVCPECVVELEKQ